MDVFIRFVIGGGKIFRQLPEHLSNIVISYDILIIKVL